MSNNKNSSSWKHDNQLEITKVQFTETRPKEQMRGSGLCLCSLQAPCTSKQYGCSDRQKRRTALSSHKRGVVIMDEQNKISNACMRDVTEKSVCGPTFLEAVFNYSHLSKSWGQNWFSLNTIQHFRQSLNKSKRKNEFSSLNWINQYVALNKHLWNSAPSLWSMWRFTLVVVTTLKH